MKIQRKDKKKVLILLIAMLGIAIVSVYNRSFAMKHYEEVDFSTGLVTASVLNVRQGPSLSYKVISKVYKDTYIRVFAKIGDWYVVQTEKDIIGAVYASYIKPIYPIEQTNATEVSDENKNEEEEIKEENKQEDNMEVKETNETTALNGENVNIVVSDKVISTELTNDEKEVLNLVNQKRQEEGLEPLQIDDDVQNLCRLKAKEMVEKSYFSHTSPTYGSTFEMIKNEKISYKVAGENIAGNSENSKAVDAWMNSENHKANILNRSYNYTGVAVVSSPKYGKIYVQIFIGR